MKTISFLTAADARFGFGLAGLNQVVGNATEAEKMLCAEMADAHTGLIIIDERLLGGIPMERIRELEKSWHGIVLALPSPGKLLPETEDYAIRLIRRAIGYHVRVK